MASTLPVVKSGTEVYPGAFEKVQKAAVDPTTQPGQPQPHVEHHDPLPPVFTPIKFKGVELKNRFVVSPMCMYSSVDGFLNDFHLVHLGAFALRGVALVVIEATSVAANGRLSPADAGIWKDEHIPSHKRVVDFIQNTGGKAAIQLAHGGRKANTYPPWHNVGTSKDAVPSSEGGWPENVVGPTEEPYPGLNDVRAMTIEDIQQTIQDFVDAAKRADQAGYDIVEIHAAHGYLLHSFYSPKTNKRTDRYGGSFENRIRLLQEVYTAIREVLPSSKPIFVRLSCSDWLPEGEGWDLQQSIKLSESLKSLGVDLIDSSSAGADPNQKINVGPGFQVPFAAEIKKRVNIPTGAVGFIFTPELVDEIIRDGKADLVFIAREFLRDPAFVLKCASRLGVNVAWPRQYERAKRALK